MEMEHVLNNGNATKDPSMYKGFRKRQVEDAEDDEGHHKAGILDVKELKVDGSARPNEEKANNKQERQTEVQGAQDVEMGGTEEGDGLDWQL